MGIVEVPIEPFWVYPEDDSVDIAFALLNGQMLDSLKVENSPINISDLPSPAEIKQAVTGSQIVSAGLLLRLNAVIQAGRMGSPL